MLEKVKKALRQSGKAFDDEITDLIAAAAADLRLVGINVPKEYGSSGTTPDDPLLNRAIVLYCKANFGHFDEAGNYRQAYDYLKCSLSLYDDYQLPGGGNGNG